MTKAPAPAVQPAATTTQSSARPAGRSSLTSQLAGGSPASESDATAGLLHDGDGQALPTTLRDRFEGSLGVDLGDVRLHTDSAAASAADSVGARAFAVGNNVSFGAGQYRPDDPFGQHLIAHEVAHTVQQRGGAGPTMQTKLAVSSPADAAEHEADRAADAMLMGAPASLTAIAGGVVQRQAGPPAPVAAVTITPTPATATVLIGDHHDQRFAIDPSKVPAGSTLEWTFGFDKNQLRETKRAGTTSASATLTVAGDQAGKSNVHAELFAIAAGGARTLLASADALIEVPVPVIKGEPVITIGAQDKTATLGHLQPWDWIYAWYQFDNVSKTRTDYFFTSWLEHGAVGLIQDESSKLVSPGNYRLAIKTTNHMGPARATPLFKPGGTTPAHALRAPSEIKTSITEIAASQEALGKHAVEGMAKVNASTAKEDLTTGVWYPADFEAKCYEQGKSSLWKSDYNDGYANTTYWIPAGTWLWRLKPGVSASAAIKAWLAGLTIADCEAVMSVVQIDSIRAAVGDDKFDAKVGAAGTLRVGKGALADKTNPIHDLMTKTDAAMAGDAGKPGARPIEVGEAAYFSNFSMYLYKHPSGPWSGENVVYRGTVAGKQIWSGFGADQMTEDELMKIMIKLYNEKRSPDEEDKIQKFTGLAAKICSQVPDKISETDFKSDTPLPVPDGTGVTSRMVKAGFDPKQTLRIDAAKVMALRDAP